MEAALELVPHIGPEPIAAAQPKSMLRFPRMWWAVYEIAAKLADILEERAIPLNDIVPEVAHRKPLS